MNGERRFRIKIEPGDVIVEIISVTLAILLALAIGRWEENNQKRALLDDSVTNIVAEIESNAKRLEQIHPRHERLLQELEKLDASAQNTQHVSLREMSEAIKRGAPDGLGLALPQSTAWQIAQSNQGIALLSYERRANVTALYNLQQFYSQTEEKFIDQLTPSAVPPEANFFLVFQNAESRLGDLVSFENELLRSYAATSKALASTK